MKLDNELIKSVVVQIGDSLKPYLELGSVDVAAIDPECDPEKFEYHLDMMVEYGLIHVYLHRKDAASTYQVKSYMLPRYEEKTRIVLTWKGQDFLNNIQSNGVWQNIKVQAKNVSLTVLMALATEAAKKAVGL